MTEQPTSKPSPQEVEKMIRDYQMVQEQMRNFQIQVEQLQLQSNELLTAKEEVGKATGKVYIAIGGVIVETSKETALKNIDEKSEASTVRLQSANKQLNEIKAREKQLREKITQMSSSLQ